MSLYERMDVSFNCLTEVPVELPLRLPHLLHVNMSHNQLTTLPESFGLLIHLHTVILNNNGIVSLPKSFLRLTKLHKLDVSHNALRSLPEDLGKMESLSKLNISSNKLKTLPASLGVSASLVVILADDNPIKWPPRNICKNGSDALLTFLRDYSTNNETTDKPLPFRTNVFPRVRGNQSLYSSTEPPRSPLVQYMQAQTDTSNTPSRVKTPLLPPIGASAFDSHALQDKIVGESSTTIPLFLFFICVKRAWDRERERERERERIFIKKNNISYTNIECKIIVFVMLICLF